MYERFHVFSRRKFVLTLVRVSTRHEPSTSSSSLSLSLLFCTQNFFSHIFVLARRLRWVADGALLLVSTFLYVDAWHSLENSKVRTSYFTPSATPLHSPHLPFAETSEKKWSNFFLIKLALCCDLTRSLQVVTLLFISFPILNVFPSLQPPSTCACLKVWYHIRYEKNPYPGCEVTFSVSVWMNSCDTRFRNFFQFYNFLRFVNFLIHLYIPVLCAFQLVCKFLWK